MEFETVKQWYAGHVKRQIRHRGLLALLGFILFPIGATAGAVIIFGIVSVFFGHRRRYGADGLSDAGCFWATVGIVALMFIVNAFIPRKRGPEKLYSEEADVDDSLAGHYLRGRIVQLEIFLWITLTGPRLLSWSLFSLSEISRLKKQDIHSVGALLWLMLVKRGKVPYDDIPKELDWLDVQTTLAQLEDMPGIVHLKNPPPGISMTDDLRAAIREGTPL
ncbi:MAG TPA: hypothetical protein VK742_13765 [Candidatus Sulfotelmatobacter sp.]|nr:hypothetical protein [Candidatus Sulfotelmatobacter sp.]